MKKFSVFILLLVFFTNCDGPPYIFNRVIHLKDGDQMLLGGVDRSAFEKPPFSDWYWEQYEGYQTNPEQIKRIKKKIKNYRIEVFIGTWNEDSRLRYPEFMKIMEGVKFPDQRLVTYAVNQSMKSFYSEENGKDIETLPTFIFYKSGKEVGRIVGSVSAASFEEEILKIIYAEH